MPVPTEPQFVQSRKPDDPLGDLDVNQYSYANFIYPMDLGVPGAGKDHYVVFHINESSTTQFATQTVNGQAPTDKAQINQNVARDLGVNNQNNQTDPNGNAPQGANGGQATQPTVGNAFRPIQR